jgi:hypothetical protein
MKRILAKMALTSSLLEASGPGVPNQSYSSRFEVLAEFRQANLSPYGQGFVTMHDGYLFLPFSADGGGGGGTGGFTFYDISNPTAPVSVFSTVSDPEYSHPSGANYAGDLREPHGFTFSEGIACLTMNKAPNGKSGLQFWDFRDIDGSTPGGPGKPVRLSEISLENLSGGDYDSTAWWVAWQGGRYAYVAGTSAGLFIVDATDPANPVELKRIPTGQLGGFRVNVVHVVGNLMVLSGSDVSGITTFDISDPLNPRFLDGGSSLGTGYSTQINNNRLLVGGDPARVYLIDDSGNITLESQGPDVADKGGYGVFKDGHFVYGSSSAMVDLDLTTMPPTSNGVFAPSGFTNPDWDFATVLGNLVFVGNDHSGSALATFSTVPDTTPPVVTMVNPPSGAERQAVTSRVGLTFSDLLEMESISGGIEVRPIGGEAVAGRFSHQHGVVNFWPDEELAGGTTYEVRVPAGGIRDVAGNALTEAFVSTFTTAGEPFDFSVTLSASGPAPVGENVTFTASSDEPGLEFSFNFADGTPPTSFTTNPQISHVFQTPGNRSVTVTARKNGEHRTASTTCVTHLPLTAVPPTRSSTIAFDEPRGLVWNVNPDNASVTAVSLATLEKAHEIAVGAHPAALAVVGEEIWVACRDADTIVVIDAGLGTIDRVLALDYGARPVGVCAAPGGSKIHLACEGTREVIEFGPSGNVQARLTLDGPPRGLAVSGNGTTLYVTRFVSPDDAGKVAVIDLATFTVEKTIDLAIDPGPDTEDSSRGLPNYLFDASLSPDGTTLWVGSKKDNIERGMARDGQPLTFESTVRGIVSAVDLTSAAASEDPGRRIDFNDRGFIAATAFGPLGNLGFAVSMPTNRIEVFDPYLGEALFSIPSGGLAPMGIAINAEGTRLAVHNYMSRDVGIFPINQICAGSCFSTAPLTVVKTVATETLPPQVLQGKRLFYNGDDIRLTRNSYVSCASCHFDGDSDGRVWDFTQMGEGFRNTTSLHHAAGRGFGMFHWSANFDEGQDFENQIRDLNAGEGLMSDPDFEATSDPLGTPKAGLSEDLDALAAYMESLQNIPRSPHRENDGSLTAAGHRGKDVFGRMNCFDCHAGAAFSDSSRHVLHDVGTIGPASGGRAGGPLAGIDTPSLLGLWHSAPYLHDGSAADLPAALAAHEITPRLAPGELDDLVAYLLQIDASETPPEMPSRAYFTNVAPHQGGEFGEVTVEGQEIASAAFYSGDELLGTVSGPPFSWVVPPDLGRVRAEVTFTDGSSAELLGGRRTEESSPAPIRINFQPPGVTPPAGYLADESAPFGPRGGSGLSFGWDATFDETRIRNIDPDPRYDTLNHMQKSASRMWEISLPNGTYRVRAVSGDAGHLDGYFQLLAEAGGANEVTVLDGSPESVRYVEGEADVTVNDGRLSLSPGPQAINLKICFVEITRVAPRVSITTDVGTLSEWPASSATLTVELQDGTAATDIAVGLAYSGPADPLTDFEPALPRSVIIPAGQSQTSFAINPRADGLPETPENLRVSVIPGLLLAAGDPPAVDLTILDHPFDQWRAERFSRAAVHGGLLTHPDADDDRDGLTLFLEYALGTDPERADAGTRPLRIARGTGTVGVGVPRPSGGRPDVDYRIEVSPDLDGWTDETDSFDTSVIPTDGNLETLWFDRDEDAGRRFFRLRVE